MRCGPVPNAEKKSWIDFLDYRSFGGRVKKAGGKDARYNTFRDKSHVPGRYASGSRFDNLSYDPARNTNDSKAMQEAIAGLEAEKQGLIPNIMQRDPRPTDNAEFIVNGNGYWDVKAPPSRGMKSPTKQKDAAESIKKELDKPGPPQHNVILDCSWMTDTELAYIRNWLQSNNVDMSRIVEVNINLY